MFATISSTVRIGNRPVGMLSLSGIRGREAYFSGMSPNQRAGYNERLAPQRAARQAAADARRSATSRALSSAW